MIKGAWTDRHATGTPLTIRLREQGGWWTAICEELVVSGMGDDPIKALEAVGRSIRSTLLAHERRRDPTLSDAVKNHYTKMKCCQNCGSSKTYRMLQATWCSECDGLITPPEAEPSSMKRIVRSFAAFWLRRPRDTDLFLANLRTLARVIYRATRKTPNQP